MWSKSSWWIFAILDEFGQVWTNSDIFAIYDGLQSFEKCPKKEINLRNLQHLDLLVAFLETPYVDNFLTILDKIEQHNLLKNVQKS